jgi:hypothetical protein
MTTMARKRLRMMCCWSWSAACFSAISDARPAFTSALKPSFSMAARISATPIRAGSQITRALAPARLTPISSTPAILPTIFSIRLEHEAQCMPSIARSIVAAPSSSGASSSKPRACTRVRSCSNEIRVSANLSSMVSAARLTSARSTPSILPSTRSMRLEHEAQCIPLTPV